MGFYSPEVIVNDARHHGVNILPVDINTSSGRCTVEEGQVRLGFRYVKEMGEAAIRKIEEEKAKSLYRSLRDLYQRARLQREATENLILVGALDSFQIHKRQLLWQLGLMVQGPDHALPLDFGPDQPVLPEMTDMEQMAADYRIQGLSHQRHPMELLREHISRDGVLKSSEIKALFSGTRVRLAGYVVCRQAPGTAKGHVFLTIEDEEGLVNVTLKPHVYQKYRYEARREPLIVVEGMLQKQGGVVNVLAERLSPLRDEKKRQRALYPPGPKARNFC
jgi:error-prone DNA polymerase